jgi:hypothetical protein
MFQSAATIRAGLAALVALNGIAREDLGNIVTLR